MTTAATSNLKPLRRAIEGLVEYLRKSLSQTTLSMFEHTPYPLENTLDHRGDPGLLGPGSMSWQVIADPAAFVGGIRGLLIQAAHPEVVAGVVDHSRYRDDPLGRLSRTSAYVTATTFGAQPEIEAALRQVRRAHAFVKGVSSRGVTYDAGHPGHSAWVHNSLSDSFRVTNQRYSERPLTVIEADRFVEEQTRIGALVGADPLPSTASELDTWLSEHPEIAPCPEMEEVVDFLTNPPLSPGIKTGYLVMMEAAVATLPSRIREILGVTPKPGAEALGRAGVATLHWALGYSPSWALALKRTGHEPEEELFRRIPGGVLERVS